MLRLEFELQAVIDRLTTAYTKIPGIGLSVGCARLGLDWTGAAGGTTLDRGTPLPADAPFRLASVTKTYTAAAILRLVEDRALTSRATIAELASAETIALLADRGYMPDQITVRQLMTHTSGIYDFVQDPAFAPGVLAAPQRRWSRHDQIAFAMENGRPYAEPGIVQHYSDTGYIILGEIIERASGRPMAAAFRELLGFDRLELRDTWFEDLEPAPRRRTHQYFDRADIIDWDPSFDLWGGGGLVSTTRDLRRFFAALFEGRVFDRPETLAAALTVPRIVRPATDRIHTPLCYDLPVGQHVGWAHAGFWGAIGAYVPELGLAIGLTVNQNTGAGEVMEAVLAGVSALVA